MRSFFIQTTVEILAEDEREAKEHLRLMLSEGNKATESVRTPVFVRVHDMHHEGMNHNVACNNHYRESSGERQCICPRRG